MQVFSFGGMDLDRLKSLAEGKPLTLSAPTPWEVVDVRPEDPKANK